jgi:hypothetical protein
MPEVALRMFEWLRENKEWLFSGVGVVLLTSLASTLIILMRRRRPSPVSEPETVSTPLEAAQAPVATPPSVVSADSLTPDQIISAIKKAPLMQQPDVARHYRGLKVHWQGSLADVSSVEGGRVELWVRYHYGPFLVHLVSFEVDTKDYPGLGLLKEGHTLTFEGRIAKIVSETIHLSDARLTSWPGTGDREAYPLP